MAQAGLTIKISPMLLEALKLPPAEAVDYFTLLGTSRDVASQGEIDQALMERTKVLRQWQNSPQYGAEVVKLLPQIHRAAKILKDETRRRVYREELEREARGERASAAEEFASLVRAALADNFMDATARKLLADFASQNGIGQAEAGRVIAQVRDEMDARRAAEAPPTALAAPAGAKPDEEWEFRIGGEGEESFELMMGGMEAGGEFTEQTPARLIAQAGKYSLSATRAAELVAKFQRTRFQNMVRRVAGGGVVRDNQVVLLAAKASAYGIEPREAYELISEYTLSAHSPEEMFQAFAAAETFGQADIARFVEEKVDTTPSRRRRVKASLTTILPDWVRNIVLVVIGGAVLILGINYARDRFSAGHESDIPPSARIPAVTPVATPPGERTTATPDTPRQPPAAEEETGPLIPKPDPMSGMLGFMPLKPGDPPAFEMSITEVTNAQFDAYLRATLMPPPPSWPQGHYPNGAAQIPVTGVTWDMAKSFCTWQAGQSGWPPDSVRLPTHAEFLRAVRGRTVRGSTGEADIWVRLRLGQPDRPAEVKQTQFDKIYVTGGAGQMYDLFGNVAEWGWDGKNGPRAIQQPILGGDYMQKDPGFDPLQVRWGAADKPSPTVGFRYVHVLTP